MNLFIGLIVTISSIFITTHAMIPKKKKRSHSQSELVSILLEKVDEEERRVEAFNQSIKNFYSLNPDDKYKELVILLNMGLSGDFSFMKYTNLLMNNLDAVFGQGARRVYYEGTKQTLVEWLAGQDRAKIIQCAIDNNLEEILKVLNYRPMSSVD